MPRGETLIQEKDEVREDGSCHEDRKVVPIQFEPGWTKVTVQSNHKVMAVKQSPFQIIYK